MVNRLKHWWNNRKLKKQLNSEGAEVYTREQMEKVYYLGHQDGKREGLAIARQQALASVKEILKQQNK